MITTEHFTWDKEVRRLVACASDGPLHELFKPGKIPSSFDIRSTHTGRVVRYFINDWIYDGDDLVSWEYTSSETNVKVIIFND